MRRPAIPLDLFIAGAGFLVALLLPLLLEIGTNMQEMAIIALAVVLLQGVTFWNLRRSQARTINRVRQMLRDQVRNQLQVIMFSLPDSASKVQLSPVLAAVQAIDETLDLLSVDSVREWEKRYPPQRRGDP
jgi:hypothetical protein